jgi:hypothetical protein
MKSRPPVSRPRFSPADIPAYARPLYERPSAAPTASVENWYEVETNAAMHSLQMDRCATARTDFVDSGGGNI